MEGEKFTNTSMSIKALLGLIEANDIAIPEIQRPFVWKKSQVRDLMDSLYKGYPTGYIILWKSPDARLKDGGVSSGKKIVIDGQQRITAMMRKRTMLCVSVLFTKSVCRRLPAMLITM